MSGSSPTTRDRDGDNAYLTLEELAETLGAAIKEGPHSLYRHVYQSRQPVRSRLSKDDPIRFHAADVAELLYRLGVIDQDAITLADAIWRLQRAANR
jgi:hypothetical protein